MITRADQARIAAALRESRILTGLSNWNAALDSAALRVGRAVGQDDPLFNLQRWLDDCGVPGGQEGS